MRKDYKIQVSISKEMHDKINEISQRYGITQSEIVRQGLFFYLSFIDKVEKESASKETELFNSKKERGEGGAVTTQ